MSREQIKKNSYDVMVSRIEMLIASIQPLGFNSEADAAAIEAKQEILNLVQTVKSTKQS